MPVRHKDEEKVFKAAVRLGRPSLARPGLQRSSGEGEPRYAEDHGRHHGGQPLGPITMVASATRHELVPTSGGGPPPGVNERSRIPGWVRRGASSVSSTVHWDINSPSLLEGGTTGLQFHVLPLGRREGVK
jgi:hypothetical protein